MFEEINKNHMIIINLMASKSEEKYFMEEKFNLVMFEDVRNYQPGAIRLLLVSLLYSNVSPKQLAPRFEEGLVF